MANQIFEPVEGRYAFGDDRYFTLDLEDSLPMSAANLAKCVDSDDVRYSLSYTQEMALVCTFYRFDLSGADIGNIAKIRWGHEGYSMQDAGANAATTELWIRGKEEGEGGRWRWCKYLPECEHTNAFDTEIGLRWFDAKEPGWLHLEDALLDEGMVWLQAVSRGDHIYEGPPTVTQYTDRVWFETQGPTIPTVLLRPRPADLWRVCINSEGGLALDDIHADGVIDNYTPDLSALAEEPAIVDVSATWFCGSILAALIDGETPGQVRTGILTKTAWTPAGDIPVIGDGFEFVELDMMPAGSMAVALLLYHDEGTYRWYQACGLWDAAGGHFDWTATPVECETAAVDFPNAGDSKGSLRRGDDASLLFAFQNSDGESVLYHCASMPSAATGTWVEV